MPEVFPSDEEDTGEYPRLSEPRSRTETRYDEPELSSGQGKGKYLEGSLA